MQIHTHTHTHTHKVHFLYSFIDEFPSWFHILNNVNCAAKIISMQVSLEYANFNSFRYISRNAIAKSSGSSIFSFLRAHSAINKHGSIP